MFIRMQSQRGAVAVLVALSMVVLLGMVGLALDTGRAYMVMAKLNAATDAAAYEAAKAVSQGTTQADQTNYAIVAAQNFFNVNFPSSYLGATATMNPPSVVFNGGTVTIGVTANATLPLSLAGVLNVGPLAPGVTSQTIRKDLDMMFVMDVSGSLSASGPAVKSAAVTFLGQFNPTTDRVGLTRFAYGSVVDDAIRTGTTRGFDRPTMISQINGYSFSGSTASSEGLWQARDQLNSIPTLNRSSLRAVVFFSDGAPNSVASYYSFKTGTTCTTAGTLTTDDGTSANYPGGLYNINALSTLLTGGCVPPNGKNITDLMTGMPTWYNAHNPASNPNDPTLQEFPLVTNTPRVVTADMSTEAIAWQNTNRAARNMVEAMAASMRAKGIVVFTLGLGAQLTIGTGPDNEKGQDVLKCMANTADAPARCVTPSQPTGLYCYAATTNDLTPCFSKLASAILRISK